MATIEDNPKRNSPKKDPEGRVLRFKKNEASENPVNRVLSFMNQAFENPVDRVPRFKDQVQSRPSPPEEPARPVDEEEVPVVPIATATLVVEDDESNRHGNNNEPLKVAFGCKKNKKWWIICSVVLVVVLAVAIGVGVTAGGNDAEDDFFVQVGSTLGGDRDWRFGSSVSLNQDGTRMAVASSTARTGINQRGIVQVFTLAEEDRSWTQWGQSLSVNATDFDDSLSSIPDELHQLFDRRLSVALNRDGNRLVLGAPYHDDSTGNGTNVGLARVFTMQSDGEEIWTQVGDDIVGIENEELLGSSVSINDSGNTIAVGSPGSNGGTGTVHVYDLQNGSWVLREPPISGERLNGKFGVSVSLSTNGDRVAVGSVSQDEETTVVRVLWYDQFAPTPTWNDLGKGIRGGNGLSMTSWTVSLSAKGERVVISNNYLSMDDFTNEDPNSLVVEAYDYDEESGADEWNLVGANIHADEPGPKTGYWVSLSKDGSTIGMGDPGTSEGGRAQGHAHMYRFDGSRWNQIGPDIDGEENGDNFGFSVALSGDARRFAVGAPFSEEAATRAGSVRAFEIPQ
jgi:hypothetical protein